MVKAFLPRAENTLKSRSGKGKGGWKRVQARETLRPDSYWVPEGSSLQFNAHPRRPAMPDA